MRMHSLNPYGMTLRNPSGALCPLGRDREGAALAPPAVMNESTAFSVHVLQFQPAISLRSCGKIEALKQSESTTPLTALSSRGTALAAKVS